MTRKEFEKANCKNCKLMCGNTKCKPYEDAQVDYKEELNGIVNAILALKREVVKSDLEVYFAGMTSGGPLIVIEGKDVVANLADQLKVMRWEEHGNVFAEYANVRIKGTE